MPGFVSRPSWVPDPLPMLPVMTTLMFKVVAGPFAANGIEVEYKLDSPFAQFAPVTGTSPLLSGEKQGSDPTLPDLEPRSRQDAFVLDRYPNVRAGNTLGVKRACVLAAQPGTHPTFSGTTLTTMTIEVFEIKADGTRASSSAVDSVTIRI